MALADRRGNTLDLGAVADVAPFPLGVELLGDRAQSLLAAGNQDTAPAPLLQLPRDRGAGVDPLSLVVGYRQALLLAALYDPLTGLVIWLLDGAPRIPRGKTPLTVIASDYQEAKNVDQAGGNILPNTAFRRLRLRAVNAPTLTWLLPRRRACVGTATPLIVSGGSPRGVRSVAFFSGHRRISKQRSSPVGVYAATWRPKKASRGRHVLRAVLTDRRGRRLQARQVVRVCRR